ncbi:hypothetical protein [Arenibaculum pallidiluteum]|uniref:hypothetical protein n=1 Tax=Arenibaculum pallidiluteum TaxID=2812559 RepID=UPI001A9701F4|nr:hypothetical protein [Arenibaculum pallidiluteum]
MLRVAGFALALPLAAAMAASLSPRLAWAGGSSAVIQLRGIVPQDCSVSVQDRGVVFELGAAAQSRSVAAIEERCNAPAGYTVTLSSRNGGELRPEGGAGAGLPYVMTYDDATPAGAGRVVAARPPGTETKDLYVETRPADGLRAGSYDDTIVVTVEAK